MDSNSGSSSAPNRRRNLNNSFTISESDSDSFIPSKFRSKLPKKDKNPQNIMAGISNDSSEISSSDDTEFLHKFSGSESSNNKINNLKNTNKKIEDKKEEIQILNENKKSIENLIKKSEKENINIKKEELKNSPSKNEEENKIQNDIFDLVKCYICLNDFKKPVMCKFCHRIACRECVEKWIRMHSSCGFCRNLIMQNDIIPLPYLEDLTKFVEYYKKNKENMENLKEINKDLCEKNNFDRCNIHKEKILYYCFNCAKKLCGKCTAINNENSKEHISHNVFEFETVKNSQYQNIVEKLEKMKEMKNEILNEKKNCKLLLKNNMVNNVSNKNIIQKIERVIEENFKKYDRTVSNISSQYEEINKNIDNNIQKIKNEFKKVKKDKNLNEKIINTENINKNFENISKNMQKNKSEKDIISIQKNLFEMKIISHCINNTFEELINMKEIKLNLVENVDVVLNITKLDNFFLFLSLKNQDFDINGKKITFTPSLIINNVNIGQFKKVIKKINSNLEKIEDNNNCINEYHEEEFYEMQINLKEIPGGDYLDEKLVINILFYLLITY